MMEMKRTLYAVLAALALAACAPEERNAVADGKLPDIYPDYVGVTIPVGIAPLDFSLRRAEAV